MDGGWTLGFSAQCHYSAATRVAQRRRQRVSSARELLHAFSLPPWGCWRRSRGAVGRKCNLSILQTPLSWLLGADIAAPVLDLGRMGTFAGAKPASLPPSKKLKLHFLPAHAALGPPDESRWMKWRLLYRSQPRASSRGALLWCRIGRFARYGRFCRRPGLGVEICIGYKSRNSIQGAFVSPCEPGQHVRPPPLSVARYSARAVLARPRRV